MTRSLRSPIGHAVVAVVAMLCADGVRAAEDGAGDAPLRVTARAEGIKVIHSSQLLGDLDLPVPDAIELRGMTIPTRLDDKGRLQLDLRGDGRFGKTMYSAAGGVPVTLTDEATKKRLRVTLYFTKRGDKTWRYRNATQLALHMGREKCVVVDANCNGIYNEPGVDGMAWDGEDFVFPLPGPNERWCTAKTNVTALAFGPWGRDAKAQGRPLATVHASALPVLEGVNEERVKIGLTPRPESEKHSRALQKHCSYMSQNDTLTHPEKKGAPGYSPEGHAAGMRSILSMGTAAPRVAWGMVSTYFHRQDVIRPQVVGFGVGYEGRYGGIDGRSDMDKSIRVKWPVLCPAPLQRGVPRTFCKESPDPIPGDNAAGFPVTAYFGTRNLKLKSHSLRVMQVPPSTDMRQLELLREAGRDLAGEKVACYIYDPTQGVESRMTGFQQVVCVIPKDPLQGGKIYEVTFEVDVGGSPYKRTWYFSTGSRSRPRR